MKKHTILVLLTGVATAGLMGLSGCKKGDNDPFLSLRSRKARITGEWELTEGTINSNSSFSGTSNSSTIVYDGSTQNEDGEISAYTEKLTIESDGSYQVDIIDGGESITVNGVWYFASKIKDLDLKNKEAVVFNQLQSTSPGYSVTYQGLYAGNVMIIDQLKNKEIIFKGEYSTLSGSGYKSSSSYDMTYEKK